jgi:thiamine pyrophosphate-dependent acetolactate synthase large subunit-like protein
VASASWRFVANARAMGAEGSVVDKLEDVGPALKLAIGE